MTAQGAATRKENTNRRYQVVIEDFNNTYSQKVDGIRLDLDGVLEKVAERHGYSKDTIKKILKKR